VLLILPYVIIAWAVVLAGRRRLDVLSVGDEEARALGVDAQRVRIVIVLAATLGTAAVVAVSGLIGFVGIIVPHTVRILFGTSYKVVLPLSILYGAAFLIVCDLIARTLVSPGELPIGVVTAFFGAPFFAFVLRSSRGIGS
jgi:iron complex transport system permease protein